MIATQFEIVSRYLDDLPAGERIAIAAELMRRLAVRLNTDGVTITQSNAMPPEA